MMEAPRTRATFLQGPLVPWVLLFLAVTGFYGVGLWTGATSLFTHDIGFSDAWHFHVPLKHLYAEALSRGELPQWASELSTGFPLLAEGQVGALYPFHLLLFSTLSLPQALGCAFLIHVLLAGGGAMVLARSFRLSWGAALLTGVLFALSGFLVTHAKHLNLIEAATWVPWLLWEARRLAQGKSRGVWTTVFVALSLLAGHPQMTYYGLLAMGIVFVAEVPWRSQRKVVSRRALALILGLGIGALLAAPQLLPTAELAEQSARGQGMTWEEANSWSYEPEYLGLFFKPDAFGDPAILEEGADGRLSGFQAVEGTNAFYWEVTGYVGILPFLFLVFALRWARSREQLGMGVLGILALLFTLGDWGGIGPVAHQVLPGYDLFRFHSRWLFLVGLVLALFAGIGLDAFLAKLPKDQRSWAPYLTLFVVFVAWSDLFTHLEHHNPTIAPESWLAAPPSVHHLRDVSQNAPGPFRVVVQDPGDRTFRNAYGMAKGWTGDLTPYHKARGVIRPNLGALYGVNTLFYYFHLAPERMRHGVETVIRPDGSMDPKQAGRLNVRYLLAAAPGNGGENCLGDIPGTCLQLLPNPMARPRFTLASFAHVVPPGDNAIATARRLLQNPKLNLDREVIVEGPGVLAEPNREGPAEGTVRIEHYASSYAELQVKTSRPAWLVTSDTYYPGWEARIDGELTAIYPANISGRAVLVPSGTHTVRFDYIPHRFRLGMWLWAVGLLALIFLGRWGYRLDAASEAAAA